MSFPPLTFPLEVDFEMSCYWIGNSICSYGEALTALFTHELISEDAEGGAALVQEFKEYLQAFGSHLVPFARGWEPKVPEGIFLDPTKHGVHYSTAIAYHGNRQGDYLALVERCTFQNLRDFLYVELFHAIQMDSVPRQCRRCHRWFLHQHGEKSVYCTRPISDDDPRTCRIVGATAVFEKKVRDEKPWEYYKRAYKKYYARMMKGNMTKEEFTEWTAQAQRLRDEALDAWRALKAEDENLEAEKGRILDGLKQALNEK